jgi:hypothetical protein
MKYSIFKRLSNQAAASVTSGLRGCDWQLEYDKIFAELIIRECMNICAEREEDIRTRIKDERQAATAYMCRAYIKEHFGVEE